MRQHLQTIPAGFGPSEEHIRVLEAYRREFNIPISLPYSTAAFNRAVDWWNAGCPSASTDLANRVGDAITLVRAVRTSTACPSQWDAWDAEGRYYYLRFRSGIGTVERFSDADWYERDEEPEVISEFEDTDPWAGSIELPAFAERAGLLLALRHPRDDVPTPREGDPHAR